jgi:hypothetical protein
VRTPKQGNIQVLLRSYAKHLAEARNHANRLIEESTQRWEAPTNAPEGASAGPCPEYPELPVGAGTRPPSGELGLRMEKAQ